MPGLKQCYYEVLGVERTADNDTIKKAFRRLALQLHPDKNLDRADLAKEEFQFLQQAYAVLSNPQERAWYDEHRLAVLRGDTENSYEDFNIDLMPYCCSSCYKGFEDDDGGFYSVYRKLFEEIIAEEMEEQDEESEEYNIPEFGDYNSDYKEVIGPFYAYWESFCTLRSFSWVYEYDTRQAENRRVSRLMEKENKKLRSDAKKDWNQRVRALVDFVKRKDKRVQAWKVEYEAQLKAKEEAIAKKSHEEKARRRSERKQLLEKLNQKKNGAVVEQHQSQLKEMEQWVSNEFGDGNLSEESMDEEATCLHCAACNKTFKSEKAFSNHEKSKKHLENLELLKQSMESDDTQFASDHGSESDNQDYDSEAQSDNEIDECTASADEVLNDHKSDDGLGEFVNDNKNVNVEDSSEEVSCDELQDLVTQMQAGLAIRVISESSAEENCDFIDEQPENNRTDEKLSSQPQTSLTDDSSKQANGFEENEKSGKKKRRANKKVKPTNTTAEEPTAITSCQTCNKKFPSRTQLFKHIQISRHAIPISDDIKSSASGNAAGLKNAISKKDRKREKQHS